MLRDSEEDLSFPLRSFSRHKLPYLSVGKLVKQVAMANFKLIQSLNEALEAERSMIPRYREEAIVDYKASIGFREGLKRLGVASY
ncbi:hypothetical protein GW17_00042624 [Ensete ventricosum]|nr:hypothetical protein GW17_00042624 [Ensete ventricosum]